MTRELVPGVQLTARWGSRLSGHVVKAVWSGPGDAVAALSIEGELVVLERGSGAVRYSRAAHPAGGASVPWHPSQSLIATGGQDGRVVVWDATTGQVRHALEAGASWVERVGWSPSGAMLAAAAGRRVRIWSTDGVLLREHPTHRATVTDMRWQPGRDRLCTTSYGGVTLLDPALPAPRAAVLVAGQLAGGALEPRRQVHRHR